MRTGLLYYSDSERRFPALNYIALRERIVRIIGCPVFLSAEQYNSLVIFLAGRVDRLLIRKDGGGVILSKNLIQSLFNQHILYPEMVEIIENALYWVSAEGVMRLSQSGLENISRDVFLLDKEEEG